MPDPCTLLNEVQFQRAVDNLTAALQAAIKLAVPMSKPSPHSRRWWNEDLSQLKKEMNRLGGTSYKYCAIADHLSHSQYKEIWNKYGSAIKQAKKQHWDDFLEGLSGKDLWMAQQYATWLVGDSGKAHIPTLKVTNDHEHTKSVTTNKEKSAVFSQIFFPKCLADDLVPPDPDYLCRVEYIFGPSMAQLHRCVARLSPH